MKTAIKNKVRVAICGGSGYTGIELLRILSRHPGVHITAATSEKSAGKQVRHIFPSLSGLGGFTYEPLDRDKLLEKADIFFLALPHGASQEVVDFFYRKGKVVIDLSADYRIADADVYKEWYGLPHAYPSSLRKAVYGLPELHRKQIRKSRLIANPGCYPTSAILGAMPALRSGAVDADSLIIDSKSGTSGAGRKADVAISFCEVNEAFKAYGIGVHRHTPEIEQELSLIAGNQITVNFTPHLVPADRGILTTIYAPLKKKGVAEEEILSLYQKTYKKEPFVMVHSAGAFPNIKNVRGSNFCHIGLRLVKRTNTLIIVSVIDNLVKGASGQAVQNMNIVMGFDETEGLEQAALFP